MKKIFKMILVVSLFILIALRVDAQAIGWYCIRAKNHIQPRLDSTLSVVEKYDVYWIDKAHNDANPEKVIYLTFDAGYENGNVEKILDVLKEENVRAGFFVLDNLLLKNHSLVERMINDGHTIANHTARHKDMSRICSKKEFLNEIKALENTFESEYGRSMVKIYRPPEGKFSIDNLKWASELGYKTVLWSFAYADWDNDRQMSPENAKQIILNNIHNGEVMLLHPTSATNAKILKEVIIELKNQGYSFGTIEELCSYENH